MKSDNNHLIHFVSRCSNHDKIFQAGPTIAHAVYKRTSQNTEQTELLKTAAVAQ